MTTQHYVQENWEQSYMKLSNQKVRILPFL